MCSPQQACSKLVNKLKQCCYFIKLLQGCHAQLVDKLVNCKTITSFGTTCNKTVELNNLVASGGARPQNLGGHLRGKLIFWGGKIEFLKRYCYLPMPLSQDFCPPPPRRFAPLSKGGDIPRNTAPGGRIS